MPIVRKTVSVPANGQTDNVLSGSIYEFLPFDASLAFANNAAATGVVVTITTGTDVIQEEGPAKIKTTGPDIDTDFDLTDVAPAGERVVVKLRNTTGAPIVVLSSTIIQPI